VHDVCGRSITMRRRRWKKAPEPKTLRGVLHLTS
jgi:hypothetical protein